MLARWWQPLVRATLFASLFATLCASLAACIVLPQTREVYDPECRVLTRQMTLETAYVGSFQRCVGDGCLALLSAAGVVTAASAVVSSSIALVGNVVYWFERQGQCMRASAAGAATVPAPAPAPAAAAAAAAAVLAPAAAAASAPQ